MRTSTTLYACALTMVIAFGAPVVAQTPGGAAPQATPSSPGSPTTVQGQRGGVGDTRRTAGATPAAVATFLKKAADGGMAEVELAQLAQQKAASDQVKSLAKMIQDDHTSANAEVKSLAQSKNVTLPASPSAAQDAKKARLSKLSGAAFDKAYVDMMIQDHQKDIPEFRKEQSSTDADVKQFVTKTLPALEKHLQMAQQAAASLKSTAGPTSSGATRSTGTTQSSPSTTTGSAGR